MPRDDEFRKYVGYVEQAEAKRTKEFYGEYLMLFAAAIVFHLEKLTVAANKKKNEKKWFEYRRQSYLQLNCIFESKRVKLKKMLSAPCADALSKHK